MRAIGGIVCATLAALLISAFWSMDAPVVDVSRQVAESLADTGVQHPVTAVLLGYRALDTLLEIAVLLMAVLAVSIVRAPFQSSALPSTLHANEAAAPTVDPIIAVALKILLPLMVLFAGYLLWAGSTQPGGAFQAGALLAAIAVALRLAGLLSLQILAATWWRLGAVIGLLAFAILGTLPLLWGDAFLRFPKPVAGMFVIGIETLLSFSIAVCLASLFITASALKQDDADKSEAP